MEYLELQLPENVQKIITTLQMYGYEAYAVGGCVRDSLLNRTPGDWDITTSAMPGEIKSLFDKTFHTLSPLVFRCLFMLFPGKSIIFPHTMESIGSKIITGFQDAKTQVTIYHKGHSRRLQFIS